MNICHRPEILRFELVEDGSSSGVRFWFSKAKNTKIQRKSERIKAYLSGRNALWWHLPDQEKV